jgi:Ca2+ transporting ATPase
VELSDPLIDDHGFRIPSPQFEELFEQENVAKDKETQQSKSNQLLMDSLGGTDAVVTALKTDAKMGIDNNASEIAARKNVYGDNTRIKREIQTVCDLICGVFEDFILQVLVAAAIVSTIVGLINEGWPIGAIEGVSIIIAILIITVVTVSQDYAKEKQFQKMMETDDIKTARVIRNGDQMTLDTTELVVGDLCVIMTGDSIPADALVVSSTNLTCSESQLTGEPHAKAKEIITQENFESVPCPFVVQGSLVETGECRAVVLAVGNRTAQGKAGLSMNMESDQTPLQKKLDSIANTIGKLGTYVAILTFIAIVIRTLCIVFIKKEREFVDE